MTSNDISTVVPETLGGRNLPVMFTRELHTLRLEPSEIGELYACFNIAQIAEDLRVAGRDPQHNYGMGWAKWHRTKRLRAEAGLPVLDIAEAHLVAMECLGYQINISTGEVRYANDNA